MERLPHRIRNLQRLRAKKHGIASPIRRTGERPVEKSSIFRLVSHRFSLWDWRYRVFLPVGAEDCEFCAEGVPFARQDGQGCVELFRRDLHIPAIEATHTLKGSQHILGQRAALASAPQAKWDTQYALFNT